MTEQVTDIFLGQDRESTDRSSKHLENSIASVSILRAKVQRAYGGCLGARSR